MPLIPITSIQPASLFDVPKEGKKFITWFDLTFAPGGATYDFDLTAQFNGGQFTLWQSIYMDNHPNNMVVTLTNLVTGQHLDFAANTLGYYNILHPKAPIKFRIASTGNNTINFAIANFYIPPSVWSP